MPGYLTAIKVQIMQALRDGPMGLHELSEQLGKAPFNVRAELKDLKRLRLVTEEYNPSFHYWRLTTRGESAVFAGDHLRLV